MHHLVVGEHGDEVLGVLVEHAESQVVLVPLAVDRLLAEVPQGVVHPAHVPLVVEAQAAARRRPAHLGERGALLGDHRDAGIVVVDQVVHPPQEIDRLQVLAAAVAVGNPLALPAGIVEVEHRGDRVDPQAVEVVAVEPGQGVGDQEAAHLVAAVVEDQRAPVHVAALARDRRARRGGCRRTRPGRSCRGEMRRHPVEDHADAALVQVVDEPGEILGRAVAVGRGEEARHLVAPGAVEGVLGDGHQLDVGEAHLRRVVGQLRARARGR